MKLRALIGTTCISAAMALSAVPAGAATAAAQACTAGKATAASYKWDFKGEAGSIFKDVQSDAQLALYHADTLQTYTRDIDLSWQSNADQLAYVKNAINDIGAKLCRLEAIRRVLAPEQQRTIDQIAVDTRLIADNVQDAITFGNAHRNDLWLATYQKHVNTLRDQTSNLTRSVDKAVEFAGLSREYRELGRKLGVRASS